MTAPSARPGFPEPTDAHAGRDGVLLGYLDYFRATVLDKLVGLGEAEARRRRLPSDWSPSELAHHLVWVERRWLEWGFEGHELADPWGDERDGRWCVPDGAGLESVTELLRGQGERTRAVVDRHELDELGRPGPRWRGAEPATLERVLLHLVQEYARHLGQLDVVVELAGGGTGE